MASSAAEKPETWTAESTSRQIVHTTGAAPTQPVEFVKHLAGQAQILACLKWLGEFQILALVPLQGSILASEIADLAGVSVKELSRVVRMMATMAFLCEVQPNRIAHTELSASFIGDFSLMDCAMFLGEVAVPSALHMTEAASRARGDHASSSAFSLLRGTQQSFETMCAGDERLQRQWAAYRTSVCAPSNGVIAALCRLNWGGLGKACIVDVAARTMDLVTALAGVAPALHFIVQKVGEDLHPVPNSEKINERITILDKMPSGTQLVRDAAVYILHLTLSHSLRSQLLAELTAHLGLLRDNPAAVMIVAPPLLPEPGSVSLGIESEARARDLTCLQLAQETKLELSELTEMINGCKDRDGRLAVVNTIRLDNGLAAAVSVKYELRPSLDCSLWKAV